MSTFTLGSKVMDHYNVMRGKKVCGRICKSGHHRYKGHAFKYGSEFGTAPSFRVADTAATPEALVAKLNKAVTN
jgi:hypothetical protein